MKRKTIKILAIGLLCTCTMWKIIHKKPAVDPLSVEAIYGRWQIKDARGKYFGYKKPEVSKETFPHIGKTVEFHKKYIIVDGEQCNNLRYIYYTYPSFKEQRPLDQVHVLNLGYRIDYLYEDVDTTSDYIIIEISNDHTCTTPKWFDDRFTLISNRLYIGSGEGFLYLERIADRLWWQRAWSYILAISAERYDPRKIVPKELWGNWEVVGIEEYWVKNYCKLRQDTLAKIKGKRFFLHPKYVILDGKQYNNPRYCEDMNADQTKCYYFDDYNGYKIGELATKGFFSINKEGIFQLQDYTCRRLPYPSFWQLVKYYYNYLIDRDDSTKGDFFEQKSQKKSADK